MDEGLEAMAREKLIVEARRLRDGIWTHRDSTGHELCWHHSALWGLLPERSDHQPTVSTWLEFLCGCLQYRQSLALDELRARFEWSALRIYGLNSPGENHGVLLGTRGWRPSGEEPAR